MENLVRVDGGVNIQAARLIANAGAARLIAGSAGFTGDVIKNIKAL